VSKRPELKPCFFVGSSRKDLKRFPAKVQNRFGYALQKKAKKGIATPLQDIELVKSRLREAELH
jgi:phage-related protein